PTYSYDMYTGPTCMDKDENLVTDADYPGAAQKTYADPLGRITHSLEKGVETNISYVGLDKTVTIQGIAGPTYGETTTSTTIYHSDAFGRLVSVDSPGNGADAVYAYDENDNLHRVTLSGYDGTYPTPVWISAQTRW